MYHSCTIPDLVGHCIEGGRLKLVRTLGQGSSGVIYLAEETSGASPPVQYAVKCVVRAEKGSRRHTLQRQEIQFHRAMSHHPNVVTLHRIVEEKYYVFLVLDYCPGGDLFSFLSTRRDYRGNTAVVRRFFLQILDALEACHTAGIHHRDLKPENILVGEDGQSLYLTDFGLATPNTHSKTYGAGSSLYMSPECIGYDPARPAYNTRENDIWALGVILTSMISGHNPWNNACPADPCYRAYLRNDRFLIEMLPLAPPINLLLQHIFRPETARRLTIPQIRDVIASVDTFWMRPALIVSGGSYLRGAAETYFGESPYAEEYLLPVSPSASVAPAPEDRTEGSRSAGESAEESQRDSSSMDSDPGPNTPEMRPHQPQLEVVELTEESRDSQHLRLPQGPTSKRRRSLSPGGILRRFMDRFFTD